MGRGRVFHTKLSRLSFGERLLVLIGLASLIVGIGCLIAAWLTITESREIAEESRAFDRPTLSLLCGGYKVSPDSVVTVRLGSELGGVRGSFVNLPLSILNEGKRSAKNVLVTIRYHSKSGVAVPNSVLEMHTPSFLKVARSTDSIPPFVYSTFGIPEMGQSTLLGLDEPMAVYDMTVRDTASATSADNEPMVFSYSVSFSVKFLVTITATDVDPQNYSFSLSCVSVAGMKELTEGYKDDLRHKWHGWGNEKPLLWRWFGGQGPVVEAILLYGPTKKLGTEELAEFGSIKQGALETAYTYYSPKDRIFILSKSGEKSVEAEQLEE